MQALVNGGAGVDLFGFAGARADYNITSKGDGYAVLPKNGAGGGLPLLVGVELLKFSDTTVNVEYDEVVQALYVAYFGRAADANGMRSFRNSWPGSTRRTISSVSAAPTAAIRPCAS